MIETTALVYQDIEEPKAWLDKRFQALQQRDTAFFNAVCSPDFTYTNAREQTFSLKEYCAIYVAPGALYTTVEQKIENIMVQNTALGKEWYFILHDTYLWEGVQYVGTYFCVYQFILVHGEYILLSAKTQPLINKDKQ